MYIPAEHILMTFDIGKYIRNCFMNFIVMHICLTFTLHCCETAHCAVFRFCSTDIAHAILQILVEAAALRFSWKKHGMLILIGHTHILRKLHCREVLFRFCNEGEFPTAQQLTHKLRYKIVIVVLYFLCANFEKQFIEVHWNQWWMHSVTVP